jgi:Zn-dependent protease with chaperone function
MTSGFSRMREVFADQAAIELYGAEPFKRGLRGVVLNDRLFGGAIMPQLVTLVREGKYLTNVYAVAEGTRWDMAPDEAERIFVEAAAQRPSAFDSHPPLRDRLDYADRFVAARPTPSATDGAELLIGQFDDWGKRSTEISDLLTQTLFAAAQLRPTAAATT